MSQSPVKPISELEAAIERVKRFIYAGVGVPETADIAIVLAALAEAQEKLANEFVASESFEAERDAATARAEKAEVQLAGCGAAAMGHTPSAKPGDYGWSASYGDVLSLRARAEKTHDLAKTVGHALDRLAGDLFDRAETEDEEDDGTFSTIATSVQSASDALLFGIVELDGSHPRTARTALAAEHDTKEDGDG